jgi:hypothetical protein
MRMLLVAVLSVAGSAALFAQTSFNISGDIEPDHFHLYLIEVNQGASTPVDLEADIETDGSNGVAVELKDIDGMADNEAWARDTDNYNDPSPGSAVVEISLPGRPGVYQSILMLQALPTTSVGSYTGTISVSAGTVAEVDFMETPAFGPLVSWFGRVVQYRESLEGVEDGDISEFNIDLDFGDGPPITTNLGFTLSGLNVDEVKILDMSEDPPGELYVNDSVSVIDDRQSFSTPNYEGEHRLRIRAVHSDDGILFFRLHIPSDLELVGIRTVGSGGGGSSSDGGCAVGAPALPALALGLIPALWAIKRRRQR